MKLWRQIVVLALAGAVAAWAGEEKKPDETKLEGEIGCAHCNYHAGKSCAVGLKTADGKIYILDNASKELMDARMKGGTLKVTGTVTEKDGAQYVHASKTELGK